MNNRTFMLKLFQPSNPNRAKDPGADRSQRGRGLAAIVVLALLARWVVMVPHIGRLHDPDHYLELARSLAEGKGFAWHGRPTAYRPPLYPMVLAPLVALLGRHLALGIAALHLAL